MNNSERFLPRTCYRQPTPFSSAAHTQTQAHAQFREVEAGCYKAMRSMRGRHWSAAGRRAAGSADQDARPCHNRTGHGTCRRLRSSLGVAARSLAPSMLWPAMMRTPGARCSTRWSTKRTQRRVHRSAHAGAVLCVEESRANSTRARSCMCMCRRVICQLRMPTCTGLHAVTARRAQLLGRRGGRPVPTRRGIIAPGHVIRPSILIDLHSGRWGLTGQSDRWPAGDAARAAVARRHSQDSRLCASQMLTSGSTDS